MGPLLRDLREALAGRHHSPRDTILIVEASTMRDVHLLWERHHAEYPGLLSGIREALSSGPWLPDDEEGVRSDNKPRNNRFVYLLAGYLLKGGASIPSIDGIARVGRRASISADIVVEWKRRLVPIECKRTLGMSKLQDRVREAGGQLEHRCRRKGVVAIDCSRLVRPLHCAPVRLGEEHALAAVMRDLGAGPMPAIIKAASRWVVGAIAFARVPTVLVTGTSPVVTPSGLSYVHALRITVDGCMHWKHEGTTNSGVIDAIGAALDAGMATRSSGGASPPAADCPCQGPAEQVGEAS